MALPVEGETIQIHSYKHNGRIHRVWQETMVLKGTKNIVIGANERTLVTESDGRTWLTREPSICYFHVNTGLTSSVCYVKTVCIIIAI